MAYSQIEFPEETLALLGVGTASFPESDDLPEHRFTDYTVAFWDEQDLYYKRLQTVWMQNLLFLSGRQWIRATPHGVFLPEEVPDWREQPVSNLTLAYFRTFLAKATKNRPAWNVMPASSDAEDIHSAKLGDDVLEGLWSLLRMGRVVRRAVAWAITTGDGYLYPYWNTNTGKVRKLEEMLTVPTYDAEGNQTGTEQVMVPLDEDGEPMLGEDGRPKPGAKAFVVDEGEVGVRAYAPSQVRVNAEAEGDEDVTEFVIAEVASLRELACDEDITEEQVKRLTAEDVADLEHYDRLLADVLGGPTVTSPPDTRDEPLEKCLVFHHHVRPSRKFPEGRYWRTTRSTLIGRVGPLPEGVWPALIHLKDVDVPGRYHGMASMEAVVGLNREYNRINAHVQEHHNLMSKGKWLIPKGSGVKKGSITNQPGEVIQFNPGFKPEMADLKPLPAAVYTERERVLSDFERVAGIHGVSMGKAPPGVTAGVAFLQLQEADDTDLAPFLAGLEESIEDLARAVLQIVKERYREERLLHVVGKNRRYEVRSFTGADLKGAYDVKVVPGSSFPWSEVAKQSMLLNLAGSMPQLWMDEETGAFDKAAFARQLPVAGLESLSASEDIDVQEAEREHEQYKMFAGGGMLPQAEWWQNHAVHFNAHVRVLKSASFQEWDPSAQEAFKAHVQQHMQMRDMKIKQAAQLNAMRQGNLPVGEGEAAQQMGAVTPEQELEQMSAQQGGELPMDPMVADLMQDQPPAPAEGEQAAMLSELGR